MAESSGHVNMCSMERGGSRPQWGQARGMRWVRRWVRVWVSMPHAWSGESNLEVTGTLIRWIPGTRRPFELGQDLILFCMISFYCLIIIIALLRILRVHGATYRNDWEWLEPQEIYKSIKSGPFDSWVSVSFISLKWTPYFNIKYRHQILNRAATLLLWSQI